MIQDMTLHHRIMDSYRSSPYLWSIEDEIILLTACLFRLTEHQAEVVRVRSCEGVMGRLKTLYVKKVNTKWGENMWRRKEKLLTFNCNWSTELSQYCLWLCTSGYSGFWSAIACGKDKQINNISWEIFRLLPVPSSFGRNIGKSSTQRNAITFSSRTLTPGYWTMKDNNGNHMYIYITLHKNGK